MATATCMVGSTPSADSVVQESPKSILIRFNEPIAAPASGIVITNEGGAKLETGKTNVLSSNARQMVIPVTAALPPGKYAVAYQATSGTGQLKGTFSFEVKP